MNVKKKYYRDIVKLFPVRSKNERFYLQNLKGQIYEYDDVTYDDLVEMFGSPIDIVKAYYDTISSEYLLKKINVKRMVSALCVLIVALMLAMTFYKMYLYQKAYEDFHTGIPTEIEEVIEVIE